MNRVTDAAECEDVLIFPVPLYIIYRVTSFMRINLLPEYELSITTPFGQFQRFGKKSVGGTVPQPPLKKNISAWGSEILFITTCASDLTFLALLTSEI